jgi:hypothetical protein
MTDLSPSPLAQKVAALWPDSRNPYDIGRELGLPYTQVVNIVIRNNIDDIPQPGLPGPPCSSATIRKIKAGVRAGLTFTQIGAELGLDRRVVGRIWREACGR